MNKIAILTDIDNQRYLSVADAQIYYQLGRGSLYSVSKKCDALKRIGRRVLIDKEKLNAYIDANNDIR